MWIWDVGNWSELKNVRTSMKSEHNLYQACEDSPQRAFFWTFSCSLLALLASTVHWLHCFLFLNAANRQLLSVLDSAKHVRCRGPAALSYPSSIVKKRRSSLSSIARQASIKCIRYPRELVHVTHELIYVATCMWAFLSVTDTYIRTHVRTYVSMYVRTCVHCENRSLIQSLALMRSAIV